MLCTLYPNRYGVHTIEEFSHGRRAWHKEQWHAQPVGFVSCGGLAGGLRAVEQLRLVLAELHAVAIRNTVSFHNHGEVFGADGRPTDPGCDVAAKAMLDQLTWWGGRPCARQDACARMPSDIPPPVPWGQR